MRVEPRTKKKELGRSLAPMGQTPFIKIFLFPINYECYISPSWRLGEINQEAFIRICIYTVCWTNPFLLYSWLDNLLCEHLRLFILSVCVFICS